MALHARHRRIRLPRPRLDGKSERTRDQTALALWTRWRDSISIAAILGDTYRVPIAPDAAIRYTRKVSGYLSNPEESHDANGRKGLVATHCPICSDTHDENPGIGPHCCAETC